MSSPSFQSNVVFHPGPIRRQQREELLEQRGMLVWLTRLSSSGKSTIAPALEARLCNERKLAYVPDGDNLRHGLHADLRFSERDREMKIRRAGEVAACESLDPKGLYARARAGEIVELTGISSPYKPPGAPALILRSAELDVEECVAAVDAELVRGALQ